MSRDYRARGVQAWLRTGQMGLASRMQGEQRLETLGDNVLQFLAEYLSAQVGTVYVSDYDGSFRRVVLGRRVVRFGRLGLARHEAR